MKKSVLEILRVRESASVKAAMKQMDSGGLRILFVVDNNGRLLGTITDGDFRRWLLSGKSLDEEIKSLFNKQPVKFPEDYDIEKVKPVMIKERLECIPVIDKEQKVIDALFWEDIFGNKYKKTQKALDVPVAIMAGGEGTRLSPYTKILPKPLIPIGDKPIIEVIMDNFAEYGCSSFYLLLGYKGAMIQSYFQHSDSYKPIYIDEKEPSGTIGALRSLKSDSVRHSLFVSNCDIIIKADYTDIYDFHIRSASDITIVGAMRHFVVPYGVIEMERGGKINKIIEKPEYDFFVNTGMYILKKEMLSFIPGKGVFHFTDLIRKAHKIDKKVSVYPVSEKSWIDIGQLELLEKFLTRS